MENQHRKIKGYRELSQEEINLMNKIKGHGEETKSLLSQLEGLREDSQALTDTPQIPTDHYLESLRCLSIAKEHLQTGQMWFVRAVALPASF